MGMFKAIAELSDVISHFVVCPDDSTVLLTLEPNSNEFWIPSTKVPPDSTWYSQSLKDVDEIFGSINMTRRMLRLYKIAIPQGYNPCIYHCVYEITISNDQKKKIKNTYGKYRGKTRWATEPELVKLLYQENLRSPELLEFFQITMDANQTAEGGQIAQPAEFNQSGLLIEIGDRILVNTATDGIYEQIVDSASFGREVQLSIYKEFIFMCYPSLYMCQQVFSRLILQLGWSREDAPYVFRAADVSGRNGLSYRDFLYVLAAMEPTTSHGGSPAEIRCRYIFRFFDRDKDNVLNFNEFKGLIGLVRKSKKQPVDGPSVNKDADACYRNIGLNPDSNNTLSLAEFLRAVGDLKLRGTSQIFRSSISVVQYLRDLQDRESKAQRPVKMAPKPEPKLRPLVASTSTGASTKKGGGVKDYELGEHTIRLQKSGTLISIDQIWNIQSAVSTSSTQQHTLSDPFRRLSVDQFSQQSVSNEVLKCLRYLIQVNKAKYTNVKGPKAKETYSWGQLDSLAFARNLITISSHCKEIFRQEPRLLDLHAPAYIMGDLHGNMVSLLYLEKVLWHLGPALCPCSLLFLGDYVDRGPFSIEVISYLFCYKMQAPNKLMLIRGNHEIREIQKMFTFFLECCQKFGDKTGSEVWAAVNAAFDTMPLAAVIDEKIFCCHGGIPPPWLCPTVQAIHQIPCPLNNPNDQSVLAWELMWNDPVSNKPKQVTDEVALELLANDGFAANIRRGTAHVFTVEALERFLNTNGFSHIIRAHEVAQAGFNVLHKGKLLTVFSSSKYCGGVNEAACILADQGKLRVLRLEPS